MSTLSSVRDSPSALSSVRDKLFPPYCSVRNGWPYGDDKPRLTVIDTDE